MVSRACLEPKSWPPSHESLFYTNKGQIPAWVTTLGILPIASLGLGAQSSPVEVLSTCPYSQLLADLLVDPGPAALHPAVLRLLQWAIALQGAADSHAHSVELQQG
jgi:hypothetical protein